MRSRIEVRSEREMRERIRKRETGACVKPEVVGMVEGGVRGGGLW